MIEPALLRRKASGKPAARCPISTAKKKSHPWRQHLGPNSAVSQRPASMIGTRFSRSAAHRPTSPGRQRPVSAPNRPTPKRCSEPVPTDDFEGFSVSARQHDQLEAREPTQRRVDCIPGYHGRFHRRSMSRDALARAAVIERRRPTDFFPISHRIGEKVLSSEIGM